MSLTIKKPFLVAGLTILFLWLLCVVASAVNGSFMPLQTSEISRLGVCLANDSFVPETHIPAEAKQQMLICGILSGDTKRTSFFYIFHNNMAVARVSETVAPGEFFLIPVWWVNKLVPGHYRVEARYTRIVVISSEFTVY